MKAWIIFIFLLLTELLYAQQFDKSDMLGYWEKVWYKDGSGYTVIYGSGAFSCGFYFEPDKVRFLGNIYYSRLMYEYNYKNKEFDKKAEANFLNTTSYIIEDSLMRIRMPDCDEWVELKIKRLDIDTLILKNEDLNYEEWFIKKHYDNVPGIKINKIIYSTGYCLGTCPVFKIEIDSDRTAVYKGIEYVKLIGEYEFKLNEESYIMLCEYLTMVNLEKCKSYYSAGLTDVETKETVVYYNNLNQKKIRDHGRGGPVELLWFYNEIYNIVKRLNEQYFK